jgi:TonB family protein
MRNLSTLNHRYTFSGLTIAVVLHLVVVGMYYGLSPIITEGIESLPTGKRVLTWLPPPSIGGQHTISQVGKISLPENPQIIGNPVPVRDLDLKEEPAAPFSTELPSAVGPESGAGTGEGGEADGPVTGENEVGDGIIDLTDPSSNTFVEKLPIPVRIRKPDYPAIPQQLGMEATVVVKILIDKEGKPQQAEIYKSENELFDEKSKQAALDFLFTPAIMNGHTVSVWMNIPFKFRINRN